MTAPKKGSYIVLSDEGEWWGFEGGTSEKALKSFVNDCLPEDGDEVYVIKIAEISKLRAESEPRMVVV